MRILLCAAVAATAAGCPGISPPESTKSPFLIYVTDSAGVPLEGVTLAGGVDWDAFAYVTDTDGVATILGRDEGRFAYATLDQYLPLSVNLTAGTFVLTRAAKTLRRIGPVAGTALRFEAARLITLGYNGEYRVYSYDAAHVSETTARQLAPCVRDFRIQGDNLWVATHNDGVYVYSVADPMVPRFLAHLLKDGYNKSVAVDGSLVAVTGFPGDDNPLRVYSYDAAWNFQLESEIPSFHGHVCAIRSGHLVATNPDWPYFQSTGITVNVPVVYDLFDPTNLVVAHSGAETDYRDGNLFGNRFVLVTHAPWTTQPPPCKVLNLTDPANPVEIGTFTADCDFSALVSDTMITGIWPLAGRTGMAILEGDLQTQFSTTAVIYSQSGPPEFHGYAPPYFVISDGLYILETP
jgi:hypothetical protein